MSLSFVSLPIFHPLRHTVRTPGLPARHYTSVERLRCHLGHDRFTSPSRASCFMLHLHCPFSSSYLQLHPQCLHSIGIRSFVFKHRMSTIRSGKESCRASHKVFPFHSARRFVHFPCVLSWSPFRLYSNLPTRLGARTLAWQGIPRSHAAQPLGVV
jgi:hypothetical protein